MTGGITRRRVRLAVGLLLVLSGAAFGMSMHLKHRHSAKWIATVTALGIQARVLPVSEWTAGMLHPRPKSLLPCEVTLVWVDSYEQARSLLTAPADCPDELKIYAMPGLPRSLHDGIQQRFPGSVLFTRVDE